MIFSFHPLLEKVVTSSTSPVGVSSQSYACPIWVMARYFPLARTRREPLEVVNVTTPPTYCTSKVPALGAAQVEPASVLTSIVSVLPSSQYRCPEVPAW